MLILYNRVNIFVFKIWQDCDILCNPWASAIAPTRHIYIILTQNYQIIVLTSWGCVTGIKKPHRFRQGCVV